MTVHKSPDSPMPPLIVIEGSEQVLEQTVAALGTAGWRIRPGFEGLEFDDFGGIRWGSVSSSDDAANALLAVIGGAGVVVHGLAPREVLDRLLGDLRHIGPVEHRQGSEPPVPVLDDDARAILGRLADGQTLGEAAVALGLSRRTADRRLAEARSALGVERTVEAVSRARLLGWL